MTLIETLTTYLICSEILMMFFLMINSEEIRKSYISFEDKRNGVPSGGWYTFYILTHILKAPLLAPYIGILMLLNGGKLLPDEN
jgi:hypothetical protein|tara:strand:+ start:14643 stop:14894 length:252 start_codon:yes stop_codon:yes gene_type:complete